MKEKDYAKMFDELAEKETEHERIAMSNPWSPKASYRIAKKYIDRHTGRILDAGCGSGGLAKRIPKRKKMLWGIDLSQKQVDNATPHYRIVRKARASQIPYPDKFFNLTVALGVIQNSGISPGKLIKELCRVSRKAILITGLSDRKTAQNPLNIYNDPTKILRIISQIWGNARCEYGAIRYNGPKVWTENWNTPDNGTFYIYAERIT